MRRKLFLWIVIGVCLLFALQTYILFRSDAHMTGVDSVATYIKRFNDGGAPQGIVLNDISDEALIMEKKPYSQHEVPVQGNDSIKLFFYTDPSTELVVFIRIDETLADTDENSLLPDLNAYMYAAFFDDADEEEILQSATDVKSISKHATADITLTTPQGYIACYTYRQLREGEGVFRSVVYAASGSSSSHFNLTGYMYDWAD